MHDDEVRGRVTEMIVHQSADKKSLSWNSALIYFFFFWKEPHATFILLDETTSITEYRESTAEITQRPLCVLCVLLVYISLLPFLRF